MSQVLLCVGTNKGAFLLRADESRRDWSFDGPHLDGWDVRNVTLDERSGSPVLWAAVAHEVYGPCIQRSDDLGKTWRQIEHGPKYADDAPGTLNVVWTVVPGPADEPEVLYAGVADAGLFVTRDGGEHWEEVTGLTKHPTRPKWIPGAGGMCCHSIVLDPANKDRMWVGISAVGILRTEDGGETWTICNEGLFTSLEGEDGVGCCVHCLVGDPATPGRLFQQNHWGVYSSDDAAETWQAIETGLPKEKQFGFPMAMHPRDSETLFIIPLEADEYRYAPNGKLAVYKTTNAGADWSPRDDGLPDNAYSSVLRSAMGVDALDPCGVYFGTSGGNLYASNDEGETWSELPFRLPRVSGVNAYVLD